MQQVAKTINLPVTIIKGNPSPWLTVFQTQLGVKEIPGKMQNNDRILMFHSFTTLHAKDDETAWCSSAMCWALETSGYKSTRSAAAKSWLTYGKNTTVRKGAILLFKRDGGSGYHVAMAADEPKDGKVKVIGGNQGNAVSYVLRNVADVQAARWPTEELA